VLDRYALDARFFTEIERFDRHLEKLRRGPADARVHYVSICSPNYLHDAHIRLALRLGAHAICEKPVVINPWNVDALKELEQETGGRVNTVLQLRLHPSLLALKKTLDAERPSGKHHVDLTYIAGRGPWYSVSWKGSIERSGGVATNIGIHFFDLLLWLFGEVEASEVYLRQPRKEAGYIECARARVRWFLSTDLDDVPRSAAGDTTFRSIAIDGQELDFTEGFTDLHTRVYEEVLAGRGFGLDDARPSIALAQRIRESAVVTPGLPYAHPRLSVGD
jgi:UDP-N-acetyl-2-amino-2-deoxyglucuronate dehydrogenase